MEKEVDLFVVAVVVVAFSVVVLKAIEWAPSVIDAEMALVVAVESTSPMVHFAAEAY